MTEVTKEKQAFLDNKLDAIEDLLEGMEGEDVVVIVNALLTRITQTVLPSEDLEGARCFMNELQSLSLDQLSEWGWK